LKGALIRSLLILTALVVAVPAHAADTALLTAVKKSDLGTVRRLLQQGTSVNVSEADGSTALHWAVAPMRNAQTATG
jgi:ankyrin repeat protein